MPLPAAPATLSDGHTLTADDWNDTHTLWYTALANYALFKDVASQVVTKTVTFTPDSGYGIDISTGGMRIQAGGLLITAGGQTITAGNLTMTAGNVVLTAGNLTFGAASAKVIPGATSLLFRDNGDANTNLSITDAGAVTIRAGLTITAGGLTVSAGTTAVQALTATTITPSSYITSATTLDLRSGSTSLKFTNNAGSVDALVYDSAGRNIAVGTTSSSTHVDFGVKGHSAVDFTRGFLQIPSIPGAPTGVPAVQIGVPLGYDTSNNKLYAYNFSAGAWKSVTLT